MPLLRRLTSRYARPEVGNYSDDVSQGLNFAGGTRQKEI